MGLFYWHGGCSYIGMLLTNRLLNDVLTNWDRTFFHRDYSHYRRQNNSKLKELDDSYEYSVPLAGFRKEDIKATVEESYIYIMAKKGEDNLTYSLLIPEDVDLERDFSADYENGLLVLKLNKKEAAKKIQINIK